MKKASVVPLAFCVVFVIIDYIWNNRRVNLSDAISFLFVLLAMITFILSTHSDTITSSASVPEIGCTPYLPVTCPPGNFLSHRQTQAFRLFLLPRILMQ